MNMLVKNNEMIQEAKERHRLCKDKSVQQHLVDIERKTPVIMADFKSETGWYFIAQTNEECGGWYPIYFDESADIVILDGEVIPTTVALEYLMFREFKKVEMLDE